MRPFCFDMETGDPDDVLTLGLLLGHPEVDLRCVTITPGTPWQVGVVRHILQLMERPDVPVGAFDIDHRKHRGTPQERVVRCVSSWHEKTFGRIPPSREAVPGWELLRAHLGTETTLVTGAPLKNLGRLLEELERGGVGSEGSLGRLFVQGGFAGDPVVPQEDRLPKFEGRTSCPSYNLNGDPKSALRVLRQRHRFQDLRFVSKNVCHGVAYDLPLHQALQQIPEPHPGLRFLMGAMGPQARPDRGKKLHDPLAAMCALRPSIARWAEVEIDRVRGGWGARLAPGSGVRIITGLDRAGFIAALAGLPVAAPAPPSG